MGKNLKPVGKWAISRYNSITNSVSNCYLHSYQLVQDFATIYSIYTLWLFKSAMENHHV